MVKMVSWKDPYHFCPISHAKVARFCSDLSVLFLAVSIMDVLEEGRNIFVTFLNLNSTSPYLKTRVSSV